MRKSLLLTSVLALTACGGGGGGHGGMPGGTTPNEPELLNAATLIDTSGSNSEITNMATAVVVKNNSSYISFARASSDPDSESHPGYTIYKLNNVDFRLAETEDAIFNFEIDNDGRIIKAVANDQEIPRGTGENSGVFVGNIFQLVNVIGSDEDLRTIVSNGTVTQDELNAVRDQYLADTKHGGDINAVTDGDRATVKWNYLKQKWTFATGGEGLTYSDFGIFTSENMEKIEGISINNEGIVNGDSDDSNHSTTMAFAGGYAINADGTKAETLTVNETKTFSGKAVGRVYSSINADGSGRADYLDLYQVGYDDTGLPSMEDAGRDVIKQYETNNAALTVYANGDQELVMPFNENGGDFYRVTVTKNDDGTSFVFDPTTAPSVDSEFGEMYRLERDVSMDSGVTPNVTIKQFDSGLYGFGEPTEAAGTFRYKEVTQFNENDSREWEFQGAYGMKVDTPSE